MLGVLRAFQREIPVVFDDFHYFDIKGEPYARPVVKPSILVEDLRHMVMAYGSKKVISRIFDYLIDDADILDALEEELHKVNKHVRDHTAQKELFDNVQ